MSPKVSKIPLPEISTLHDRIQPGDFVDCYATPANTSPRKAAEIIVDFPSWAQALVKLRGIVTAPFGLDQDGPNAKDKLGSFPVESETDTELIAGFDDKHLEFRVSVICQDQQLSLATWVHPHNIGGRLYLATIMPFHILIARNAVARAAKAAAGSALSPA
ncbi:DUF2867 domain-containing protein [Cognatishimia activa]|uniref:DUF2867 domain-containing protein n=1 Tax=Cognatishimia activa TaxID=1715691 RepID=A0A0P1JA78_9RHOB|nr:DUF2867 domain-containing protein [Cognatishimia activa]CUI68402.1 hypothetical protein TA5113_01144 [Cognatishimia activa]CUK26505.1 hypothetical protein TA5114_02317 [Cognatishimia activa]